MEPDTLSLEELFAKLENIPGYQRAYYALRRQIAEIRHTPRKLKWSWQRIRRGYSDQDTWGFDSYLREVIPGGLRQLRERKLGHPARLTPEAWDEALDAMIAGFEALPADIWDLTDEQREIFIHGMEVLTEYFFDLWD